VSEHLSLKKDNEALTARFEETVRERVGETQSELEKYRNAYRENVGLKKLSIHSKKLGAVFELADKFHTSPTVPVLIEGETGTGKELLARYVHYGRDTLATPFVAINCGAIPSDLFESELFGHESGAFTGAGTSAKKGQFEMAENGSLFLDEIGDMPMNLQVKLLRVLEEREFYRIGGVKKHTFDSRIIASTNKSLTEEIETGRFRRDLYHRLNVGYIRIPPLRERKEEIIPLAYDFIERASARHGKKNIVGIDPQAEAFLLSHPWPGNIRQLENAIERVVLLYDGPTITLDQLAFLASDHPEHHAAPEGHAFAGIAGKTGLIPEGGIDLDELITKLVDEAMEMAGGNKAKAAKLLNISPRTISRRLEKLDDE
jgi:transcriptional regulator with PAS, ATPase and Fis domain